MLDFGLEGDVDIFEEGLLSSPPPNLTSPLIFRHGFCDFHVHLSIYRPRWS